MLRGMLFRVRKPWCVAITGSLLRSMRKQSYVRFLEGVFRKAFELSGTPLRVQFKQGENPFAETDKRKAGEGLVTMRRRKNELRAAVKKRKEADRRKP